MTAAGKVLPISALLALVLGFLCPEAPAVALPQSAKPQIEQSSFVSKGKPITVEWYYADDRLAKTPIIIILHGSGGVGQFFRDLASPLCKSGSHVMVVHYFDQNDLDTASSADMARHFNTWLKTVGASIDYAARQPFVDSNNISLLGHSLGAELALHTAARDHRISSVIDMAGCFVLPTAKIKRMPPVLILHGKLDKVVPLNREKTLKAVLERTGTKYEEHIFARGDHAFDNVSFSEIISLCTNFLNQHRN